MVKCLIRIKTKVNVHLRMINHCYRDVKVRVLSLGPRLLGKALGVLPLFPALPGGSSNSGSGPGLRQESRAPSRLAVPLQLHGCSLTGNHAGKNQAGFVGLWYFVIDFLIFKTDFLCGYISKNDSIKWLCKTLLKSNVIDRKFALWWTSKKQLWDMRTE